MCGIFGYIGEKNAADVIFEGLKRLEYRGYDSWGIAVLADQIYLNKKVGAIGDLNQLINLPKSKTGIGHTRWATHGGVIDGNAHPHYSTDKSFVLAQNGIVENYQALRSELKKKGHKFQTETDTEVIVRLVEEKLKKSKSIKEALRQASLDLKGRNTVIVLTDSNQVIAVRNGSPLVVGVNKEEIFFSSDTLSFAPFADKVLVVDNGQMVFADPDSGYIENARQSRYLIGADGKKVELVDIKSARSIPAVFEKIDFKSSKIDKEGYDHFMLKEISESPYVIRQIINQDLNGYQRFAKAIKAARNIYIIGSGTAGIAASQIAFYLRVYSKIRAQSVLGADMYDYFNLLGKNDLIIAPSQSGETADVLEVLEIAKQKGVKIASYVNMPGSTMTRISDYKFMAQAGPEVCVMSTKVFTSQITWGYLVSKIIGGQLKAGQENIRLLADSIEKYLNTDSNHRLLKDLAKMLCRKKDIFLLGKYQNFNIVKEGMIKIIEGSYIHAHGIPAGDLKHYAITLMEEGVPVIVVVSDDVAKADVLNSVNQVKVRKATVIGVAPDNNESFDYFIKVPEIGESAAILNIIPLQLLAYYMAVEKGFNVDKPRNIAKSVTVK